MLMGMIAVTTGMRIGEVLGLRWQDLHFGAFTADFLRSFSDGAIGPCKTEISEPPVPLDDILIEGLRARHPVCGNPKPDDWVFANDYNFGKTPLWPDNLGVKVLQPVACRVGIRKKVGWHTFRRTYSSLLAATGDDVKVLQELMRHAKVSTTMAIYAQAAMEKKHLAQRRAVDVLLNGLRASKAAYSAFGISDPSSNYMSAEYGPNRSDLEAKTKRDSFRKAVGAPADESHSWTAEIQSLAIRPGRYHRRRRARLR
jgi:integrase